MNISINGKSNHINGLSRYFVIIASLLLILFSINSGFSTEMKIPMAYGVLFVSVYLLWYVRNNSELSFIFLIIAYSNYSICLCSYISTIDTIYSSYSNMYVSTLAINILFVFMFVILLLMPRKIYPAVNRGELMKTENKNQLIVSGIIFILIVIFIFCFNKPNEVGERGAATTIYEYSIILFMLGFYYSGKNKFYISVLLILILLFGFQDFFYGGRIMGIQCALVYVVMFYLYKINLFKKLPIIFVLFVLFSFLGFIRADHTVNADTFLKFSDIIKSKKFAFDTAYSSYFTSMTFLRCENIFSHEERFHYFLSFIKAIFLGVSRVEGASLQLVSIKYFFHDNGGIVMFPFHFYLGWFGVVFSGWVVSKYLKLVNKIKNYSDYKSMLSVYFIVTSFRWYLYSPINLFRGFLIFSILYGMCKGFDYMCKNNSHYVGVNKA